MAPRAEEITTNTMQKTGVHFGMPLIIGMSWNDIETRDRGVARFKIVNAEVPNLS
jgi:hypothetical protein